MSSETSSRSTRSPILSTNWVSNAIDSTVNGGAALLNEWTRRTRFGSAADAFPVQRMGIAKTTATTRKNCARRTFQMSHNRNLPGIRRLAATPVAAFAGVALDIQRPAAQAWSFQFTKGCDVPYL